MTPVDSNNLRSHLYNDKYLPSPFLNLKLFYKNIIVYIYIIIILHNLSNKKMIIWYHFLSNDQNNKLSNYHIYVLGQMLLANVYLIILKLGLYIHNLHPLFEFFIKFEKIIYNLFYNLYSLEFFNRIIC